MLGRMIPIPFFLCLCLLVSDGVFGADIDVVKSVSVTEGDSVTLNTDVTEVQRNDHILWMFGPRQARIAELYKQNIDMFDSNVTFGDRLKMDSQTGSLTIRNITTEHSGLYKLRIVSDRGNSDKTFRVTVYAPLPVPVITRNHSKYSSSPSLESSLNCSLLCSVVNVSHVTLSWLKGNSSLSSISVSDLSISLSLSLEVGCQDKNTYSCQINNPIGNKTTHLDISQLCEPCSEPDKRSHLVTSVIVPVVLLVIIAVTAYLIYHKRSTQTGNEVIIQEEEVLYTEPVLSPQVFQTKDAVEETQIIYSSVKT